MAHYVVSQHARAGASGSAALEERLETACACPYRRRQLLFRESLRRNATDRDLYERAKRELSRRSHTVTAASTNISTLETFTLRPGPQPRRHGLARGEAHDPTLTGPGGVGKTRLAIEAAGACLGRFPDDVWFVDLGSLTDGELIARTVALTLRIYEVSQ